MTKNETKALNLIRRHRGDLALCLTNIRPHVLKSLTRRGVIDQTPTRFVILRGGA